MEKYIALSKAEHRNMGWRKALSFDFAAGESAVPVLLEELPHILPTMPLAFIQHPANDGTIRYELAALLSLTPGLNLYLAPDGRWIGGYIPSAFRGYPFRLLPDQSTGQLVLCFNQESGLLTGPPAAEGEAFFDAEGNLSQPVQNVMTFLKMFEEGRQVTQQAVDLLAAHNLIDSWPVSVGNREGEPAKLSGVFRVDEPALKNLEGEALKKLQQGNALSLAYAQLLSQHRLSSFTKLYDLHQQLKDSQQPLSDSDIDLDKLFGKDDILRFN